MVFRNIPLCVGKYLHCTQRIDLTKEKIFLAVKINTKLNMF